MIAVCQWCGERRDVNADLQCVPCAVRSLRAEDAWLRSIENAVAQDEAMYGDD